METGNDLVFAGELGLEVGVFGFETGELFLKFADALEKLLDVWWGAVFHYFQSRNRRA